MKHFTIIFLLVLLAGTAVFAEGSREVQRPALDGEILTLTGTIDVSANPPVLRSGSEEYLVMVPRAYRSGIEIEDGDLVSLEGYVHEGLGRNTSDQQVISVTKAVIDGTEYDIESFRADGATARGSRGAGDRGTAGRSANSNRGSFGKTGSRGRR